MIGALLLGFTIGQVPPPQAGAESPAPVGAESVFRFGMSTCLTGPSSQLGTQMRQGVLAEFERWNREHAPNRRIELISYDDGYEPRLTAPNTRKLITEDAVLAIVGNVGTPTAVAAVPIAKETKTLFFAPYTGAGLLRPNPPSRYIINYRASYAQETGAMIDALVTRAGLEPKDIAFFTQRDAYGDAGFAGACAALNRHGFVDAMALTHLRYERNSLIVEHAVAELLLLPETPKAIVMVGTYAPCAKFIDLVTFAGVRALMMNVSFVGSASLAKALGPLGADVIVTQVVPYYRDATLPIVGEFDAAMQASAPDDEPDFVSFEGFLAARVLTRSLEPFATVPSREQLIDAIEGQGEFEIGAGSPLSLSATDHQASDGVWPTILVEGRFVPFDWANIAGLLRDGDQE